MAEYSNFLGLEVDRRITMEPFVSRSQQKRIAAQTKAPEPFAAVKRCIKEYEKSAPFQYDCGLRDKAREEVQEAEEREAKWRARVAELEAELANRSK
jgi:hypothetical protein